MITLNKISREDPYKVFKKFYDSAEKNHQKNIEAFAISSINTQLNEVESRFVNLKYINNDEWIFFSNYLSNKAQNFIDHEQISALFYWNSINVQIRIKARIKKTSTILSDEHFKNRSNKKNALAISSKQSNTIDSYNKVIKNYELALKNLDSLGKRPDYWGGYSFFPYYFEFWEGHNSRLNKRQNFTFTNRRWISSILQP